MFIFFKLKINSILLSMDMCLPNIGPNGFHFLKFIRVNAITFQISKYLQIEKKSTGWCWANGFHIFLSYVGTHQWRLRINLPFYVWQQHRCISSSTTICIFPFFNHLYFLLFKAIPWWSILCSSSVWKVGGKRIETS